ncbi:hypothetical protein GT037_001294 [Alternaria burnsii]|uniref:Uncharacterized protein n=1 Tax=Alternaria burnsii TaxID=1187904 RepID=A0A8H7BI74_9PLEO|nr:uncharacterized protein GT037_001294 [Alternaria burnsii]KAF7682318.1 hypothetical protein GT037_001294 [Alternaria burnsii]
MGCMSSKSIGVERSGSGNSMKLAKSRGPTQTMTNIKRQAHAKVMEVVRPSSRCGGSHSGWAHYGGGGGGDSGGYGGGGDGGGGGG